MHSDRLLRIRPSKADDKPQHPMPPLQTVILHHVLPQDSHYDWLLQCPSYAPLPDQRLWTARITLPPQDWPVNRRIALTPLAPHRAVYLTYEGPVSGNRGHVTRIAQGQFTETTWTPERKILHLQWEHVALRQQVEIHQPNRDEAWLIVLQTSAP
jgi:hypothetical protein